MSLYSIAAKYNGPLEAAHAHIDDDGCNMVECNVAGQLKMDLSDQLGDRDGAVMVESRVSSASRILCYYSQV